MEKKLVVDEGGNKRTEISADDIKQALTDISQWLSTNAQAYYSKNLEGNKGNSEEEVEKVLKNFGAENSQGLKIALQKFNGGFHYLDTYKGLTLTNIMSTGETNGLIEQHLVPFAVNDFDGTLLCLSAKPSESVVIYDLEGKEITEDLKQTFGQYLESFRNGLLSKKIIYEDELGLVSVQ